MSACTLFLGLENTCITRRTAFGFHGPGSALYGIGLPPDAFERWSRRMANYYPEPLRTWFLATGRYRRVGFHEISGAHLIKMGIAECAS